jgi:hypothetical protein
MTSLTRASLAAISVSVKAWPSLRRLSYLDVLCDHYPHLRRYLPDFVELPFQGEPGAEVLLKGLTLARALNARGSQVLPRDAPVQFVPAAWRSILDQHNGTRSRRVWEIALAQAVRDALRSGDLYLAESRRHVPFWHLVYEEPRWEQERGRAYAQLALPSQAQTALQRLQQEFDAVAQRTAEGMAQNGFAAIRDGRLCLKRLDALDIPDGVRELRRVLETHLPRIRIEDVLPEVDAWCGFTRAFQPWAITSPARPILLGDRPEVDKLTETLDHTVIDRGEQIRANAQAIRLLSQRAPVLAFVNNHFVGYAPDTIRAQTPSTAGPWPSRSRGLKSWLTVPY